MSYKIHTCYKKRKGTLSGLGYNSYASYLESEDWKKIRNEKLSRHPDCVSCGSKAGQIHHLSYAAEVMLGLNPILLAPVCSKCHLLIEFEGGEKLTLEKANKRLFAKAIQQGHVRWVKAVKKTLRWLKRKERKNRTVVKPPSQVVKKLCIGCQRNQAPPDRTLCRKCRRDRSLD